MAVSLGAPGSESAMRLSLILVWTNIPENAIDAMDGAERIVLRTWPDGDHVVVEIEDNGKGIPADALPCILQPFFTSIPQGEGPGLGLDTAWRIVTEEHAGSIAAASEPGRTSSE
jgi:C4-dicarboxylate-specific signal transduction histidine kinase